MVQYIEKLSKEEVLDRIKKLAEEIYNEFSSGSSSIKLAVRCNIKNIEYDQQRYKITLKERIESREFLIWVM
ncbi:hypothetical protein [Candidatus Nanopusillus massiliensis]|uniref:hypothetical protein n=1 Tax=Candidatus Nanopusillus massiliensis TaxID=2897163 RepID=UPI001E4F6F50|nr:hypothetical protein [Candidatus Nanopusillus massiliensis]